MNKIRTIGVLTSGGDAPGMNTAIRAVVNTAAYFGVQVKGVKKGYAGLLAGDYIPLTPISVDDTHYRGGTVLGSARCLEFKLPENVEKSVKLAKDSGIDALVVIGGDGSFRGARDLSRAGLPTVAIPGTIDNDIGCSDYCIGFNTALRNVCLDVENIRDTMYAHDRCSFVEVMGRNAGHIALVSAIVTGADAVLIPEREFDILRDVVDPIVEAEKRDRHYHIVIVAEGVGNIERIAKKTEQALKRKHKISIETKVTVLGHTQRGGSPTVTDRLTANRMGVHAVKLLLNGKSNRVVAMKNNKITDYDIEKALEMTKDIDQDTLEVFKILSAVR